MKNRVGIMQGRLSKPIKNRIQAFPHQTWRDEFETAQKIGFQIIEWVFDDFTPNPIMNEEGIKEIIDLSKKFQMKVNSLCADYFMTNLLFNESETKIKNNIAMLIELIKKCYRAEITIIELPFVDSSSLRQKTDFQELIKNLNPAISVAQDHGIIVALETDLQPELFTDLLKKINHPNVKANYDVGNSTANGFDICSELDILKNWIVNVHVKDRVKNGNSVPLGTGNTNFKKFFDKLKNIRYRNDLIIQGAREDFKESISPGLTCSKYLKFVNRYLENHKGID